MSFIIFYTVAIFAIFVDQLSKYLVRRHLPIGKTLKVWEGKLHFTHIQNSGAAFGFFKGYGRLFVPVAVIVTAIVIYMLETGEIDGIALEIGAALYVGGAIGNAIDRVLFNQVTDFIHFQIGRTIYNLADYFLGIGVVVILIGTMI